MFITNPEVIENKIGFNSTIGKYLVNHKVPLLAIEGDIYYFSNIELVRESLKKAPLWIKLTCWFTP